MTCVGIQKESRPIRTCHWMSHCTPQPAISLERRSVQSAARRTARVLMATGAVATSGRAAPMATGTLLRGLGRRLGGLDAEHLHVEEEGLAGERMVEVEDHRRVLDLLHGDGPRLA